MDPALDAYALHDRFKGLLHGLVHGDPAKHAADLLVGSGRRPQEFIKNLAPIAERHGVLDNLQCSEYWQKCINGNWATTTLSVHAVELGVTILEIEAVYRLTYGGK